MPSLGKIRQSIAIYLPKGSLRKRFAAGMTWVTAGSLFRQGANFLIGVFVARLLGLHDFGKLAVLQSTIYMLANFGQAGIGLSATKYVASSRNSDPEFTGKTIGLSLAITTMIALVMGSAMFAFSRPFAELILPKGDLGMEFRIASGWVVTEMIGILQLRLLGGLESFRSSAWLNLFQGLLLLPVVYIGTYMHGLIGAIVAFFVVSATNCIAGHLLVKRECGFLGIRIGFGRLMREHNIFEMSVIVWLSGVAMNATNWLVGIMLARSANGVAEFALFNAASRFQNILVFFPLRIFQVAVPVLANLEADGNRRGFAKGLLGIGSFGITITLIGSIIFIVFPSQLMSLYGKAFSGAVSVLQILALSCVVSAAWTIASAGLWAAERSRQMLVLDFLRGILLVTLCAFGFAVDARGLAMANLISYSVALCFLIYALLRFMRQPKLASD